MKLFLYDKFFEAFIKLNKGTQKKVVEFKKKFQENSKSAAIHLEPIIDFKDDSLRTARIDQKYRAILKVVGNGAYYLLWVDNHDEAMDWARNKRFDWNQNTNSMQVFSSEAVVEAEQKERAANADKAEARLLDRYKDAELEAIGVPQALLPSVRNIDGLEELEALEKHLPRDAFENLFYLLDGEPIDRIIEEVQEGASLVDDTSNNNARSFVEVLNDDILESALEGAFDKWRHFLHPSQKILVSSDYKGSVKVSGGAGTGKTVAALHRLKHLVEVKSDRRPVLFTTYTKALTANLNALASSMGVTSSAATITNFDKLAFDLASAAGVRVKGDSVAFSSERVFQDIWDDLVDRHPTRFGAEWYFREYEEIVLYHDVTSLQDYLKVPRSGRGKAIGRRMRAEVWEMMERFIAQKGQVWHPHELYNAVARHYNSPQARRPFSHAIVDELQDLSNIELRLLRSLVDVGPNDLMLVGDPMQSIYNRKINFSKVGIHIRGKRSKRLRINYRTTEEIKKVAMSVVEGVHFDDFDGGEESKKGYVSLIRGFRPKYQMFARKYDELGYVCSAIKELLESGEALPSEIAVGCRKRSGVKDIESALHSMGVPHFFMDGEKRIGNKNGTVALTLHNLKGLEFKHVFLIQVNDETAPLKIYQKLDTESEAQRQKSEKSLYYVAASRAIQSLTITGFGNPSEWFEKLMMEE